VIIVIINVLIIALAYLMQDVNAIVTLISIAALTAVAMGIIYMLRQRDLAKRK
jgi:hypothetical protein